MPPTTPYIHESDEFMATSGYVPAGGFPRPNMPPPNPALGDRMRNRNWAAKDAEYYYQMRHAPRPTEYTRDTRPHPDFPGAGGPGLQRVAPQGPPTGFQARNLSPSAVAAWTAPRPRGGWMVPYNSGSRLVGQMRRNPTLYAWPNQAYPGGSNTYIPSWEATGLLIKFTRQASMFRINKYLKELKVPKDQGYYLTLSSSDPYRSTNINDFRWEDSTDAPGGRDQRLGFAYVPYRTARFCFPFSLGRKSVQQAEWPVLAEHALMAACKAMTVRTKQFVTLVTTLAQWTGTFGTNSGAVSGAWSTSSDTTLNIISDIGTAMVQIEQASGGIVTDEEALLITMNPIEARNVAKSPEYRGYIKGSPDALSALTDQRNPNRKYQLAPQLYGLNLVVENAVVVASPKPGNVPSPPSSVPNYIWPTANVLITSRPQGVVAESEQTVDFSTVAGRFYENQTVEQKDDPDNRRSVGRVVEDYSFQVQAPMSGYLFTGAS